MKKKEETLKETYSEPKVLSTYKKEDLEEIIKPHGTPGPGTGGGCGCGGGSIMVNDDD